jgi:c-di-AMP phosphodiesterase-like protein
MRLYFVLLIVFAVLTFFFGEHNQWLALGELVLVVLIAVYTRIAARRRADALLRYIETINNNTDAQARHALTQSPLPVVIFSSNSKNILWTNDRFRAITDEREHIFEVRIADVVPDLPTEWISEGKSECPKLVTVRDKKYKVYGSLFRVDEEHGASDYLVTTYWVDITEYSDSYDEYVSSRPITSIIMLDNYEELVKNVSEKDKSAVLSAIDERINRWVGDCGGLLCKYDRDRYLFVFEARSLDAFVKGKFAVLESARDCVSSTGVHATLSIGLGVEGKTPADNFSFARLAIEMALSRGGDQAVIKNRFSFEFFGGHSAETEKRTKVKSRVMANAFSELIGDASSVFIMGHHKSDFDTVGAAAGICCISRGKGKRAYIVLNTEESLALPVIERLNREHEYDGVFITSEDAILRADSKSLLVIVDTSRPEEVESAELLASCNRIAVIDHHRRAATYIENSTLNFHEAYASSACELVTEMLQYLSEQSKILVAEAEALLSGIVLDTKTFAIHTGSRTFDAAAFLRRAGADTVDVKRYMQSDFATAMSRYDIVRSARMYHGEIAVAMAATPESRVIIAQAADELLNIAGVSASFVVAPNDDSVFISGRSIGDVNVQLILERFGGGGNQSVAGANVRTTSADAALAELLVAIDEYRAGEA